MARPKKNITKAMLSAFLKKKRSFKKKKSKHPLANNPEFTAHPIELGNRKQDVFELDPNIDGSSALHFLKWGEEELKLLWEGILYRSLSILRYESNVDAIEEELIWIASQQFDDVSIELGFDANVIRFSLPSYMKDKSLSSHSHKLLQVFNRLNEECYFNLTRLEAACR